MPGEHTRHESGEPHTRALFDAHAVRYTRKRAVIYEALASTESHPTVDELFGMVKAVEPGLSLATVYNTLEVLVAGGLCRRLTGLHDAGACRYDADVSPHVHVVVDSGEMIDVPEDLSRELLAQVQPQTLAALEARLGVKISRVDLRFGAQRAGLDAERIGLDAERARRD